jgi:hypothetical protein
MKTKSKIIKCLAVSIIFLYSILYSMEEVAYNTEKGSGNESEKKNDAIINQGEGEECSICLEVLDKGRIITLYCDPRHKFHSKCIFKYAYGFWPASEKFNCPVCRSPRLFMETVE